jgi:hypothetical protein
VEEDEEGSEGRGMTCAAGFWVVNAAGKRLTWRLSSTAVARDELAAREDAAGVVDEHGLVYAVRLGAPRGWTVAAVDQQNLRRRAALGLEPLPALGGSLGRRFVGMRNQAFGRHFLRRRAA